MSIPSIKSRLRAEYRGLRHEFAAAISPQTAAAAATYLRAHPAFLKSKTIAAYYAVRDELNTLPMISAISETKQCYLPVITCDERLIFVRYQPGDALQPNAFGILEPAHHTEICPPEALDMVLLPLLAFDAAGHRLGTGGGYYDRTFAFMNTKEPHQKRPHTAGIGYAFQEAEAVPTDPWDVSLDSVITERGFRLFSR